MLSEILLPIALTLVQAGPPPESEPQCLGQAEAFFRLKEEGQTPILAGITYLEEWFIVTQGEDSTFTVLLVGPDGCARRATYGRALAPVKMIDSDQPEVGN
jgi:hypothetical protein